MSPAKPWEHRKAGAKCCDTCQAWESQGRPEFAGKSRSACPTCGACKAYWRKRDVAVDPSLPHRLYNHGRRWSAEFRAQEHQKRLEQKQQKHTPLPEPPSPEPPSNEPPRDERPKSGVYGVPGSVARHQAAEVEWQRAYNQANGRRLEALRRLGLEDRPACPRVGGTRNAHGFGATGQSVIDQVRAIENAHDPRAELLDAARTGDADAVARADALFVGWRRQELRRHG
jgi:hypothetical protein